VALVLWLWFGGLGSVALVLWLWFGGLGSVALVRDCTPVIGKKCGAACNVPLYLH